MIGMSDVMEHVACLGDGDVLAAIGDPSVDIAIWRRKRWPDVAPLMGSPRKDVRFVADAGAVACMLPDRLAVAGYPSGAITDALSEDIADLACRFAALLSLDRLEIRLEYIRTNACRKFHADHVRARLLVTYAGPGTQWLERSEAARVRAGDAPRRIEQVDEGDVAILRGWLGSAGHPAFHRSPPIEGTGGRRLLLAVGPPPEATEGDGA